MVLRSNQGMGLGSSRCWRLGVTGIEQDLSFEQRAQHVEQAIGNAAQRTRMIVAARAQRRIALAADGVVLNGDPRPMIGRGLQARVAGMTLDHHATLAAALGDRSNARQRPQGVVISPVQRLAGLGEQRGDVDPSEPWIGTQDRDVALLANLPRRGLGGGFDGGAKFVEPALGLFDLSIDEAQPRRDGADMGGGGGDGARRHR